MKKLFFTSILCLLSLGCLAQIADKQTYLSDFKTELQKQWPKNRTLNVVFHGHSVPAGFAKTPVVNTLNAYPYLTLRGLKTQYPYAVVNTIVTGIGGENCESGQKRFEAEVLNHRPDVLLIDYALNDRGIGLERSEKAWRKMIEAALAKDIKVILLTPTPDQREDILDDNAPLEKHSAMIRELAREYHIGLVDSYRLYKEKIKAGEDLKKYMSQVNHPNVLGHYCVTAEILTWFY